LAALQWTARALAVLLFGLVAAIALGEGVPNPAHIGAGPAIIFFSLVVTCAGLLAAWRWEVMGAVAAIAGLVVINVVEWNANHKLAGGAFPWFAAPAVLYLVHAALVARGKNAAA
jgi:hypothetical protein